jgi:hypothetical protein
MKIIFTLLLVAFLSACSGLNPKSVTSTSMNIDKKLIFKDSPETMTSKIIEISKARGWKVLYKGQTIPSKYLSGPSNENPLHSQNFDKLAWNNINKKDSSYYARIQVRTETSFSSYGAIIFIAIEDEKQGSTMIQIAASTSQISEKDLLEKYISEITSALQ